MPARDACDRGSELLGHTPFFDEAEVLTHITHRKSGHASAEEILCELCFCLDRFPQHHDVMLQLRVPQIWLLTPNYFHHFEGELQMTTFVGCAQ